MKHHERAKMVRDEYERFTGVRPPYPRSTKALNNLLTELLDIEFRRLGRILNNDDNHRAVVNDDNHRAVVNDDKPKKLTHYERARKVRDEYELLSGKRPPHPSKVADLDKLRVDLDKLRVDLEFERLVGILNEVPDEPTPPPPTEFNNFYQREFAAGSYLKLFS